MSKDQQFSIGGLTREQVVERMTPLVEHVEKRLPPPCAVVVIVCDSHGAIATGSNVPEELIVLILRRFLESHSKDS